MKFKQLVYLSLAFCFASISINCMIPDNLKRILNRDQVINIITKNLLFDGKVNRRDVLKSLNSQEIARQLGADQELVQEALEIMLEDPSVKLRVKQFIQSLAPQDLNKLKGFAVGAGAATITWLLGHAFCHEIMEKLEPQTFLPAASLTALTSLIVYKTYKALSIPKPVKDVLVAQAVPTALGLVDKLFEEPNEERKEPAK